MLVQTELLLAGKKRKSCKIKYKFSSPDIIQKLKLFLEDLQFTLLLISLVPHLATQFFNNIVYVSI